MTDDVTCRQTTTDTDADALLPYYSHWLPLSASN